MSNTNKSIVSKSDGYLKQSQKPYFCTTLTECDIPEMLKLQALVVQDLKPEEQVFIVQKQADDLKKILKQSDMGILGIGIFSEGKLIAQSITLYPSDQHPDNSMVDMEETASPDKTTVISNVLVDPAYRGNNLMEIMVTHWIDMSKMLNKTDLIAEVEVNNTYSWSVFLKSGLKLHSMGKDSSDGTIVYNTHSKINSLNLTPEFNKSAKKECVANDFKAQSQLFKEGYQATSWNKNTNKLTFLKKR